jgi:ribosome-associated protein
MTDEPSHRSASTAVVLDPSRIAGKIPDAFLACPADRDHLQTFGPATLSGMERREIPIRGEMIRLGQLLKLADFVDSGGEARDLLENEEVLVNGERETRRGRQLHPGDVISLTDAVLEIVPIDTP